MTKRCIEMTAIEARLARLRATVPSVTPAQALVMVQGGAVIVDVREPSETAHGSPEGARQIQRGNIDLRIEIDVPDYRTKLLLICEAGTRSLLAADDLRRLGYTNVACVDGGIRRWKAEGLPFTCHAG